MTNERRPVAVEIRTATAPDGTLGVLIQLPDAYVLVAPADAYRIADLIVDTAEEIDRA